MSFLFDILFIIYMILYLPVFLLRGKGHKGFGKRFGFFSKGLREKLSGSRNIWIHAVSVGEVAAIEPLLRGLKERSPDTRIVLSVTTKTGHAFAVKKYAHDALVIWSPLDLGLTVRGFVKMIAPVAYIAAETELWPNLFRQLSRQKVPIVIVNGRISDTAWPRYKFARPLLKGMAARVDLWGMQSALDEERVLSLGARSGSVHVVGNMKFDNVPDPATVRAPAIGATAETKVLLAGSTHSGEEEAFLKIFREIRSLYLDLRLVLVPRHPERAEAVAHLVRKKGLEPVMFSRHGGVFVKDQVLIVDTIGHLMEFYAAATVVFVGKSLTVKGGHNIIEPALFAKAVIIGPHMQNFRDIAQAFLSENAVVQVKDAVGLKKAVRDLLTRSDRRDGLGQRARVVVDRNRGAAQRTLGLLKGLGI